jgi:hypothetical protein
MKKAAVGLAIAAIMAASPVSAAELLTNGNFETGTFAGWTVVNQAGGSGNWNIDAPGTTTPTSGFPTPANPAGGSFYAVTDQTGPGAHVLLQAFTLAAGSTATLSFDFFARNAGSLTTRSDIDYTAGTAGFYRVDILTAGAGAFSTAVGDVVQNLVLSPGSTTALSYSNASFGLGLAPGSYQLRFAEVDNAGFFNLGVDNVSINATSGVPEPATWAMMLLGFGVVAGAMRSARRKKVVDAFA